MFERELEFLKKYEELCKEYNLGVDGCGCCGSPFLTRFVEKASKSIPQQVKEHIDYIKEQRIGEFQ